MPNINNPVTDHDQLLGVSATDHHVATVGGDIAHDSLTGRSANNHHTEAHTAASHSDQGATGAELETLTDGSSTALHTHAQDPAQANQAAVEAETNEDTYVPPDLLRNAPSATKAYGQVATTGALIANSYNVSSITDTDVGKRDINWDTDFSNANYAVMGQIISISGGFTLWESLLVGSARLECWNDSAGARVDYAQSFIAIGDQ